MSQRIQSREEHPWREVISGMRGAIHWHSLLQGEGLAGWRTDHPQSWTRQGAVLMGSAGQDEGSRLIAGQADWQDYELSLLITPLSGGNAQVMFRCSEDGRQYYLFDMLLGWQALAISRGDLRPGGRLQKLSVVNFALELGQEYNVMIAARGRSLTTYVDGHPINQLTDDALPSGPMALNVWESKTAFHDPRIRLLS